jgi:5-methylcytosine-specific restriction endonuclease McrA
MEQSKTCTKCKANLPLTSFHVHNGAKANKDGRRSYCKDCSRVANQKYVAENREMVNSKKREKHKENPAQKAAADKRYNLKHADKISARNALYYQNNIESIKLYRANRSPEQMQRKRESDIAYGKANRHKTRLHGRKYRLNNPEQASASSRKYRINNPQISVARAAARRSRLEANGIFKITKREILALRNQTCFYCKMNQGNTVDHVIPLARGGTHSIGNLVSACQPCNSSKGIKTITEWNKWKLTNEQ